MSHGAKIIQEIASKIKGRNNMKESGDDDGLPQIHFSYSHGKIVKFEIYSVFENFDKS